MKNVNAKIINGISKKGSPYKAVQFEVMTSEGVYKSPLCFPSSLEIALVEKAINSFNDIYSDNGDTSPEL